MLVALVVLLGRVLVVQCSLTCRVGHERLTLPSMRLLWLAPTAIAAACDTLADIISDEVVASEDDSEDEDEEAAKKQMLPGEAEELRGMAETRPCCCPEIPEKQKLTGEQDFMVSMVPMLTASIAILATHPAGTP